MLYEHNKIVYEKLIETLSVDTCACIVMGTGVGKSYVALEYITQHNCTALIVSPRTSINDSWKKLCGDKCDVITYQKLANIYKEWDVMISTLNRTKLSIKHKAQNIGLCRDLEISQRYLRKKRD